MRMVWVVVSFLCARCSDWRLSLGILAGAVWMAVGVAGLGFLRCVGVALVTDGAVCLSDCSARWSVMRLS